MNHETLRTFFRNFSMIFWCVCLFSLSDAFAQTQIHVKGVVTDESKEPVIGAVVMVKGDGGKTAITDLDGAYYFESLPDNAILEFSCLGMKSKSVVVAGRSVINVVLESDVNYLDDAVVIGYGTVKKSDLTGSVKGLKSEEVTSGAIASLEQSMAGRIAGVKVTPDYSPGGGINIQIRGSNSMMGGTEPLYVVDGFPLEPIEDAQGNSSAGESVSQSSMNFINPDDIESMEVLKDASATAIYGARGANGVVIITTKSGKSGKSSVTYNGKLEIGTVAHKVDVMNAEEFATMVNQKELNRYWLEMTAPDYTGTIAPIDLTYDGIKNPLPWDMPDTDWQDEVYRTSISHNHTIQVQGAAGKSSKYSVSLGYRDQQGIVINSDYKRYTVNTNFDAQVNKRLKITNRFNASRAESNGTTSSNGEVFANRSVVTGALLMQPVFQLDKNSMDPDEDLDYGDFNGDVKVNNPWRLATYVTDEKINMSIVESIDAVYELSKSVTLNGKVGVNYTNSSRNQYWPRMTTRGKAADGIATVSSLETMKLLAELIANYDKKIGRHSVNVMAGVTMESSTRKSKYDTYAGFPSDDLSYYGINDAKEHYPTEMTWIDNKLLSYIARGNYNYDNRYLLTATFRADGSTRFAENKKWGFFPSVAFAWKITEEPYMPKLEWLDNLKLRASFGQTGSESGITSYMSLGILESNPYSFNDGVSSGYIETNIPNPSLTWETTDQYNVGIDASFFNSKLLITVDAYYKITHDLLQNVNMPGSFGYTSKIMNMGRVDNKGLEFEITAPLYTTKDLFLNLSFNGAFNRNKLVSLGDLRSYILGPSVGSFRVNRFIEGYPLGVFWGLEWDGVIKDWDEAKSCGFEDALPGEYKFVNHSVDYEMNPDGTFKLDADGNKIPCAVQSINDNDMVVIGDPNPDFTFGLSLDFSYKKFDFNLLLTGQIGGDIYWNDYALMVQQTRNYNSLSSAAGDSWTAPFLYTFTSNGRQYTIGSAEGNMANATLPSPKAMQGTIAGINKSYRNASMNSSLLFDASYLKISNISIGYTFKIPKVTDALRISAAVNNIYTFTSYPGYDPEIGSFVKNPMRRGIDIGSYPSQRTFMFSLSVKF